jgi:hypothetical protein
MRADDDFDPHLFSLTSGSKDATVPTSGKNNSFLFPD